MQINDFAKLSSPPLVLRQSGCCVGTGAVKTVVNIGRSHAR